MEVAKRSPSIAFVLCFCSVARPAAATEPAAGQKKRELKEPGADASDARRAVPILAAHTDDVELLHRSRSWYVLSQDYESGLLHGLPQRLAKAASRERDEPMWKGVDDGLTIKLVVERDRGADGQIVVGFFSDFRWWLADPVQVRCLDDPSERFVCRVDRLPKGQYWIGAMVGGPPELKALGVHRTWPAPIEVAAGKSTIAELRVSTKFRQAHMPGNQRFDLAVFAGQWTKMDPSRLITVRTVDRAGVPLPFCSLTLFENDLNDGNRLRGLWQLGTDEDGYGYCDQLRGPMRVFSTRFDILPERLALRSRLNARSQLRELADSKLLTLECDDFVTGTGRIHGRVYDSAGQPLTGYFLTIDRVDEGADRAAGEFRSQRISFPVMDSQGRFAFENLPPGDYEVIHATDFDRARHAFLKGKHKFHLADEAGAQAKLQIELEARELRYGLAVLEDGSAVTSGGWYASVGSHWHTVESDGSFRVSLSKEERQQLPAEGRDLIEFEWRGRDRHDEKSATTDQRLGELSLDPSHPTAVILHQPAGR